MRQTTYREDQEGAAILIVMCVAAILLIAMMALSFLAGNASHMSRKLYSQGQSLEIAEAGIADMIYKMTTNYNMWRDGMTNEDTLGDGSYVASTETDTNTGHVLITSVGTVGSESTETVIELLGTIWDLYNSVWSEFDAIITGGNITFKSAAITINGALHANGNITKTTASDPTINGDVSASGTSDVTASGTNTTTTSDTTVTVPSYLEFDEGNPNWYDLAQSNGLYYGSSQDFPAMTSLTPSNGVIYVNGNITFGGNSSFVGTLVASGSITVNNRLTHTPFNTNWPAMLAEIDINLWSLNSYYGVIWAGNNIDIHNNRTITGTIIAMNNLTIANRVNLDPLPYFPAWDPADTNKDPPEVVIGGWLK